MSSSPQSIPFPTIHPTLFNAIFNPKNSPNTLETPKFICTDLLKQQDGDAASAADQPQRLFSFPNAGMNLFTFHPETDQRDPSSGIPPRNPLLLDAPHASMETHNFCYVGEIFNGKRHNSVEHGKSLMLVKCERGDALLAGDSPLSPAASLHLSSSLGSQSLPSTTLVAKFVCSFKNGLMNDNEARAEWYELPQGVTWEQDVLPWWQQNMRAVPQNDSTQTLNTKLSQFLSSQLQASLKASFAGGLANGLKDGSGCKMKWIDTGDRYEGEFVHGKRHGQGTMEWPNQAERYTGQWHEGLPHGQGSLYFFNVQVGSCNYYEGDFKNGARDGKGVFYYGDGTKFDGEWHNDQKNGWGEFEYTNGVKERGYYENDVKIREGVASSQNSVQGSSSPRSDGESCPSSRGSSPRTPKSVRPASRARSNSAVSRTGSTRKRALSRKGSRLKNRRAAKELQAVNNQQFDNIPFYIDDLLMHTDYEQWEIKALWSVLTRYAPRLQSIYNYYSLHGANEERIRVADGSESVKKLHVKVSKQNDLSLHQFWKFARDCGLISLKKLSLAAIDRIFMKTSQISTRPDIHNVFEGSAPKLSILLKTPNTGGNIHSPQNKIRFREFCEALFRIAYSMHHSYDRKQHVPLSERFQKTLEEIVFPNFEKMESKEGGDLPSPTGGDNLFLFSDAHFAPLVHEYEAPLVEVFRDYATLQSHNIRDANLYQENDATITVRQFLRLLDTKNFVGATLSLIDVMNLLDESPPSRQEDNSVVPLIVDRELIFEEFVEILIRCALKKYASVDESPERRVERAFGVLFGDHEDDEEEPVLEQQEDGEQNGDETVEEEQAGEEDK
uniref:Uncharacterized protein n=1 Tax=Percolomonas cosmopolitus TaxID=63605 RepID=A0A7S1KRF7_9EUKA